MIGRLEPYLNFKGNTKEAMNFYAEVFELDPPSLMTFAEMPSEDQEQMEGMIGGDMIAHGAVDFNGTMMMGSDTTDQMFEEGKLIEGNKYYLCWSSENPDDVRKVWDRFMQGGASTLMPLEKTFWAELYGILKDRFGVQWMIQVWTPDESDM